jgi:hypothetical protein
MDAILLLDVHMVGAGVARPKSGGMYRPFYLGRDDLELTPGFGLSTPSPAVSPYSLRLQKGIGLIADFSAVGY